jgi:hypothetical protein
MGNVWSMGAAEAAGSELAEAAGDYVRAVAPNVTAVWAAAEDVLRADGPEDVTSGAAAAGLAVAVAEAARDAAEALAAELLAGTFGAVAVHVAEACGFPRDAVSVSWSDSAEDVGYVLPVSVYVDGGAMGYPDAWAVVDAWGDSEWPDTLARFAADAMAEERAAV